MKGIATPHQIAELTEFVTLSRLTDYSWANPCPVERIRSGLRRRVKPLPRVRYLQYLLRVCTGERLLIGDQELTLTNSEASQFPADDAQWCAVPDRLDDDSFGFSRRTVGLVRDLRVCELRGLWYKPGGFASFESFFDRVSGDLSMTEYRRLVTALGYAAIEPGVAVEYPKRFVGRQPLDAPKETWPTYELTVFGSRAFDRDPTIDSLVIQSQLHFTDKAVRRWDEEVSRGYYQWRVPSTVETRIDRCLRLILSEVVRVDPVEYGLDLGRIEDVTGWDPTALMLALPSEPESSADPWQPEASVATDAA